MNFLLLLLYIFLSINGFISKSPSFFFKNYSCQKTYGYSGKDLSDSFRRSPHAERWVPQERHRAMLEEDILFFYIPMVEIGDSIGVLTPITRGIIDVMGIMMDTNYWEKGVTLEELGLTGLSAEQIVKYANTGQK